LGNFKAKINISLRLSSYPETKIFLKSLYNALELDTKISTSIINSYILDRNCIQSLIIEITTSGMTELRSFINSYLRLIKTIYLCITNLLFV